MKKSSLFKLDQTFFEEISIYTTSGKKFFNKFIPEGFVNQYTSTPQFFKEVKHAEAKTRSPKLLVRKKPIFTKTPPNYVIFAYFMA